MKHFLNLIIFLFSVQTSAFDKGHFLACRVQPVAASAIKLLQAFKGMGEPNCQVSDDCVELDHYPEMSQGYHGTCWRLAATNVLRHAISNQEGVCIDKVSPFSFTSPLGKLNFGLQKMNFIRKEKECIRWEKGQDGYAMCPEFSGKILERPDTKYGIGHGLEGGSPEEAFDIINNQNGKLHIAPSYIFDCDNEAELMNKLDDLAKEECGVLKPWKIKTEGGQIELNVQVVSSICTFFHQHGNQKIKHLSFIELMTEIQRFDPQIDTALHDSLSPPSIVEGPDFEFLTSNLVFSEHVFSKNESFTERYKMIRTALEKTQLPVILHIGGGVSGVVHSLHLSWIPPWFLSPDRRGHYVTVTAARTRKNGAEQIYIEDSASSLTGWHDLRVFETIDSYRSVNTVPR